MGLLRVRMGALACTVVFLTGCSDGERLSFELCDGVPCGEVECSAEVACPDGQVCKGSVCLDKGDCSLTCEEAGRECGEWCGLECGSCGGQQYCEAEGVCACLPECRGAACGDPDGCGGTCEPCPNDVSCSDCVLRLEVVSKDVVDGLVTAFTVALDYAPPEGGARAGIADLRLKLEGPASLQSIGQGDGITNAGKGLHRDPYTGQRWTERADGSLQVLVLSTTSAKELEAGRWLVLKFVMGNALVPATVPISVSLIERQAILAPVPADQALWGGGYDAPVVVWPVPPSTDDSAQDLGGHDAP